MCNQYRDQRRSLHGIIFPNMYVVGREIALGETEDLLAT